MKTIITSSSVLAVSMAILLWSCGEKDKRTQLAELQAQQKELATQISQLEKELSTDTTSAAPVANEKVFYVSTVPVKKGAFAHILEIQGKTESDKNVTVTAKMGGQIVKMYVDKGQSVKKGTLLAQIDSDPVVKGMDEVKNQLEFAKTVFEKQKALWDQKIGSEIQFLQAKNNVDALEKRLISLKEQLEMSRITAPVDGTVDQVFPKEGENTGPGAPVFRIVNTSSLKVTAEVAEAYAGKVKEGKEAEIFFPDIPLTQSSRIRMAGNEIHPMNRTFQIEMGLASQVPSIKANMITYVRIKDYENKNAISVPLNIVQRSDAGEYIYVEQQGVARKKTIRTGLTSGSVVEVLSGLSEGENIITEGYQNLVDGQKITLK